MWREWNRNHLQIIPIVVHGSYSFHGFHVNNPVPLPVQSPPNGNVLFAGDLCRVAIAPMESYPMMSRARPINTYNSDICNGCVDLHTYMNAWNSYRFPCRLSTGPDLRWTNWSLWSALQYRQCWLSQLKRSCLSGSGNTVYLRQRPFPSICAWKKRSSVKPANK